jgi:ABC-type sugar transport system permease subunit
MTDIKDLMYKAARESLSQPIRNLRRIMLLYLFEFMLDVVTISINNLFQSFDLVGENIGDYLNYESA